MSLQKKAFLLHIYCLVVTFVEKSSLAAFQYGQRDDGEHHLSR